MDDEWVDPREPIEPPTESIRIVVRDGVNSYFPSPDAIAAECERIQQTWTADQRSYRRTGLHQRHLPQLGTPVIRVADLVGAARP
jgi:hypothetical protein